MPDTIDPAKQLVEDRYEADVYVYNMAYRDGPGGLVKGGDTRALSPEYKNLLKAVELHGESTQHAVVVTFYKEKNAANLFREKCSVQLFKS